jgi:hypothetical protein
VAAASAPIAVTLAAPALIDCCVAPLARVASLSSGLGVASPAIDEVAGKTSGWAKRAGSRPVKSVRFNSFRVSRLDLKPLATMIDCRVKFRRPAADNLGVFGSVYKGKGNESKRQKSMCEKEDFHRV